MASSVRKFVQVSIAVLFSVATAISQQQQPPSNSGKPIKIDPAYQKLADETGLNIKVCHLPPSTSKWNKIEHAETGSPRAFRQVCGPEIREPESRLGSFMISAEPESGI